MDTMAKILSAIALLTTFCTSSIATSIKNRTTDGFLWTTNASIHGLVTDSVTPSSPVIKDNYDVIVIGAGFAGLTAARDISADNKTKVLLVEARDRIGGRTWTAQAFDDYIEMGGTWVHWFQSNVYQEIVRYGLQGNLKTSYKSTPSPLLETIADQFFTIDNHTARDLMPWPLDPLRSPNNNDNQTALWRKYSYISLRERLDALRSNFSQDDIDAFEIFLGTTGSQSPAEISFNEALKAYASAGYSMRLLGEVGGVYRLAKGGMTRLAGEIFKGGRADRIFGAAVERIEQNDEGVVVKVRGGREARAKYVINTVPLNVAGSIAYEPELPAIVREAYAVGQQNKGYKFTFRLAPPNPDVAGFKVWRQNTSFAAAFAEQRDAAYDPENIPSGSNVIAFGYNDRFTNNSVENSTFVLNALQVLLEEPVNSDNTATGVQVAGYVTHDWAADPYSRGIWSGWKPGAEDKYLEVLQQRQGRVYMASADWANGWRGYMDGGIEQGLRAARDVSKVLAEDCSISDEP